MKQPHVTSVARNGQLSKGGVGKHTLRSGKCDGDGLATRLESVEQRDVKRPSKTPMGCAHETLWGLTNVARRGQRTMSRREPAGSSVEGRRTLGG